ncbi:MAG: YqcI/YcgG family protein [Egibacteraceae bacterium]
MGARWDFDDLHDPPRDWVGPAYEAFADRLLDSAYPCDFGVRGQRNGHNSFAAVDDRERPDSLVAALLAFRERAWRGPRRQSLVVFVGPPRPTTLDQDHERFWALLERLSAHDPAGWPQDVPRDPRHPGWQWCFGGEPWFTFACSPAYSARRSRNVGPCLVVVFQTRRVFEGLSGSTPAGRAAKQRVRASLMAYDAIGPHPHLGDPQHSSTHKWRQYALPDDQRVLATDACPFHHQRHQRKETG